MRNKHLILLAMLFIGMAVHAQKKTIITDVIKTSEVWLSGLKVTSIMTDTALVGASDLSIPTAKAVKTYVLNHSGGGGGGGGDDWGAQVVVPGSGLTGNGTTGSPLDWAGASVAGPLTGSGTALSPLNLLNNSITATHIATGGVDSLELAPDAVQSSDIANGAVWRVDIAANAIDSTKISPDAVQSSDIANGAVWRVDIAANAIDSTKISPNSVQSSDIANGAVWAADLAANVIDSSKIKTGGIGMSDINQSSATVGNVLTYTSGGWLPRPSGSGSDNWGSQVVVSDATLTGSGTSGSNLSIAVNAIDSTRLAASSVQSSDIANGAVWRVDIAANAIDSTKISPDAVQSSDIANGAVWRVDIAANAIDSTKISPDAVQSSDIANGAVWRVDIAANAIDSTKISPNSVQSSDIKDGEVWSGDIATNAITNSKMADNAITGAELANASVDLASADITGNLPETNIANGTLLARVGDAETVTGGWTFQTGMNTLTDNAFRIADNVDGTKRAVFQASGISALSTQTYDLPNASGTLALTSQIPASLYTGSGTIPNGTIATIASGGDGRFNWANGNSLWIMNDGAQQSLFYNRAGNIVLNIEPTLTALKFGSVTLTLDASKTVFAGAPVGILGNPTSGASFQVLGTSGFIVPPIMSTTERDAVNSGTAPFGSFVYNNTTGKVNFKELAGWSEIGGGGGGGSVATDAIWDAKGDLAVGTGANTAARLAVGTDGKQIFADAAESTGLRWGPSTISPAQITSDQDDYSPTGWAKSQIVRISGDNGIRAITSLSATYDGDEKTIINVGSYPLYFPVEHPDGTAANRITGIWSNYFFRPGAEMKIRYDGTSSRWRISTQPNVSQDGKSLFYIYTAGSNTAGDYGEVNMTSFGSGALTTVASTTTLPAALGLSTSTSNVAFTLVYITKGSFSYSAFGSAALTYKALISLPALSDGTDSYTAHFQITNSPTTSAVVPNNTIGIRYSHDINSGKWLGYSKDNSGAESTVDLGITVSANQLYNLTVEIDKERSEIRFYVDGVYSGRLTANLPNNVVCGSRAAMLKTVGTTARILNLHTLSVQAIYP